MTGPSRNSPRRVALLLAATCILASVAYAAETPLTNGVPLTGQSGSASSEKFYRIDVPAGQDDLEILTTGGTGDVDLYVRFGALPTTTSYDYRPYKPGNEETVAVESPTAGTWYIMLRGYSDYANVTLKATYSAAITIVTLTSGVPVTGLAGAVASEQLFKIDVPASQLKLEISISGGTGDADLYVKRDAVPTTTSYDYRPYLMGSEEAVSIDNPTAGTWYIMVRGYAAFSGLTLVASYTGGIGEELQNGVPVTGISGAKDSEKIYRIEVPAGQTNLEIAAWGGTGDADLYVKFGARPTKTDYDYRPYLAGTDETVTVNTPTAGTWYVMLLGYSDYSGASLKATYGDVYTLQNGVAVNGLSGLLNSEKYYKIEVPTGQDTLTFMTSSGTGNVDVYIKRGTKPTTSTWDHRLVQSGNAESISIGSPAGGTWYVLLKATQAYSGVTLKAQYSFGGTVTLLSNGVPVTDISGAEGSERIYRLLVPAGQTKLEISISGGTGDADLYVKRGSPPTAMEYDYRPYLAGNEESVTINNPTADDWFMMVRGYRAYAGLTLVATYSGGTPPPEVITLQNGVAVTGISGAADSEKFYKIDVPAGQSKLEITVNGGTGDVDLYVKKGAKPTTTEWDYRPYLIGNNESVAVDNPDAATWYVMLRGYAAYSGVTLKATYVPVPDTVVTLTNGVPVPGLSGAAGSEKFYKIVVPAGQDFLNVEIAGGTGDADLYVKKGDKPTTSSWDYRPYLIGNNEKVEIATPAAATWYIMLRGYAAYSGVTLTATYGVTVVGNNFASDPNCAALWQFETGLLTKDSIGTNTLTNVGDGVTASATAKQGASSGSWDATDYMKITDAALSTKFPLKSGTNNKKVSVSLWFQCSLLSSRVLFSKNDSLSTNNHSFALSVEHTSGTSYYLHTHIGTTGGANDEAKAHAPVQIYAGRWYHLGATYDDSNKSYRMRLYDATTDSVTESTGNFYGNISLTATDVLIGAWLRGGGPAAHWAGLIDEVAVFNDILTAAEIDKIRQGTYGKP
ncbi:MAG: pre-peptidase C-terminal domain-containing protein [Sedimentisphaerales bacterium]|nr:pre-peptidase C-terminal domain-containing protein [Sedimentisphaerales bacterium]